MINRVFEVYIFWALFLGIFRLVNDVKKMGRQRIQLFREQLKEESVGKKANILKLKREQMSFSHLAMNTLSQMAEWPITVIDICQDQFALYKAGNSVSCNFKKFIKNNSMRLLCTIIITCYLNSTIKRKLFHP